MSRPGTDNLRAHDPRRDSDGSELRPAQPAHHPRIGELEIQLAEAQRAMAQQRREFDEDATSFGQAIARLAHSERTLGQTKAKLLEAEARANQAEARITALSTERDLAESLAREQRVLLEHEAQGERERAVCQAGEAATAKLELQHTEIARLRRAVDAALARELEQTQLLDVLRTEGEAKAQELEAAHEWTSRALAQEKAVREMAESLSRDSAAGAAECARLTESLQAAEEREQSALSRALKAESAQLERASELAEVRRREAELTVRGDELELQRNQALEDRASVQAALTEREAQLVVAQRELAGAAKERSRLIGVLTSLEALAREIAEVGSQARAGAEARSGTAHEEPGAVGERECITLKPEPASKLAPRSLRISTAPEILIDGVLLDP